MVECQLPKLDVAGSSPVSRSIFNRLRASLVQRAPKCSISVEQNRFQPVDSLPAPFQPGIRVNVQIYV